MEGLLSLLGPLVLSAALAVPSLHKARTLRVYLMAVGWVFFAHVLPLIFFCFSAALTPEWKGGAQWGWLDCFHQGKIALLPLVVWAVAASYAREVWGAADRAWVVLGYLAGALTSAVCLLIGVFIVKWEGVIAIFMLVPLITALLYGWRASQLLRAKPPAAAGRWGVGGSFSTLFAASLVWSHQIYQELPDDPPDCFIVTAASRGHVAVVGARSPLRRGARTRYANAQLRTFWALEDRWAAKAPRSHALTRRVYGWVGPQIARRMGHPLVADAVFLALKPLEWAARRLTGV